MPKGAEREDGEGWKAYLGTAGEMLDGSSG